MSLQNWLKKQQLFDKYILEEFQSQNLNNPPSDLGFVSQHQWNLIQRHILSEKRKDIKDSNAIKRLQQKLDKIGKIMKKERKKQINNKTDISIEKRPNLSPKKAINKTLKSKSNKKQKKNKKENTLKLNYKTKNVWNPLLMFVVIENWIKLYEIQAKYDRNLRVLIIKYFPLFGIGKDGDLLVNEGETKYLKSNHQYDFNSIMLHKNSKLTIDTKGGENDKIGGRLYISCLDTLTMNESSKISVKGYGQRGGEGGDCGGGSYGRKGICKNLSKITKNSELKLGVGGKGSYDWVTLKPFKGGNGGGIIKIECSKLIMNNGCILTANGCNSNNGAGTGGIIWIKCLDFVNYGGNTCCISSKGGKPNGDDGRIRIDVVNQKEKAKILKIVQCRHLHFGG